MRSLAFDKTGTLTRGTPVVADVVAVDGVPVEEVLRLAAAVNRHSEHPIGRVIAQQATARGLSAPTVTVVQGRARAGRAKATWTA